jgi:hypothetical protein
MQYFESYAASLRMVAIRGIDILRHYRNYIELDKVSISLE